MAYGGKAKPATDQSDVQRDDGMWSVRVGIAPGPFPLASFAMAVASLGLRGDGMSEQYQTGSQKAGRGMSAASCDLIAAMSRIYSIPTTSNT
jgi:hypothetical protein